MSKYIKYVEDAINQIARWCDTKKQFDFFNESDLKCFLYAELVFGQGIEEFQPCDGFKISPVHTEVWYDIKGEGARADILIIEPNEFELKHKVNNDGKKEIVEFGLKENLINSIVIELKHFWGEPKNYILEEIKSDIKKLKKHEIEKNSYVIVLDMDPKLEKEDIENLDQYLPVKVVYITKDGEKIFRNYKK